MSQILNECHQSEHISFLSEPKHKCLTAAYSSRSSHSCSSVWMDYVPTLLLNNVRSCCCCWMVLQIKLNSFPLWKHDSNAFKPLFVGEAFKGKHWNREFHYMRSHLVHLTKFSIFKSGSSIYHFLFFSSQGYSIPTTSPTAWESEGESFHVTPTPALGGTILLLTELFPSIWVQFAVWALTSNSITFPLYSTDTNRHFPLPQTWTCTPVPPPPLPPSHTHSCMDAKFKLSYIFYKLERCKE